MIPEMIRTLFQENPLLAWLGLINLVLVLVMLLYMPFHEVQVLGINSLIKPIKFGVSIAIYAWTMAMILPYLSTEKQIFAYSLFAVVVMVFEQGVILVQAFRGELSHFSTSPFGSILFGLMGILIGVLTLWTLFLGISSFWNSPLQGSSLTLQGIRWGIILFSIAGFLGYYMGSQLRHTVGGLDGGPGLPFVNWSTKFGDVRVAHFFGLHALQLFPLAGYWADHSEGKALGFWIFLLGYTGFFLAVAIQAFSGNPLISIEE